MMELCGEINKGDLAKQVTMAFKLSSFQGSLSPVGDLYKTMIHCRVHAGINSFMFDAERPKDKKAEDRAYHELVKGADHGDFVVYKTFQLVRRDALEDLRRFVDKYEGGSGKAGIKLVRGAYWDVKRDDVFYMTKKDTDASYNMGMKYALEAKGIPVCIATHNARSVEIAKSLLKDDKKKDVSFAQLLGMADGLSNGLVCEGYRVMKYVPYGAPNEMVPYLGRRLVENYKILEHVIKV